MDKEMSAISIVVKEAEQLSAALAKYGLEVDYQKYFEQRLNIPIKKVEACSEIPSLNKRYS